MVSKSQDSQSKKGRSTAKLFFFIILVLAVVAVFKWTNIGLYFSREYIETTLNRLGAFAPVGYVVFYGLATTLGVPGTILTIIGGVVFGSYLGTLLIVIGATLGACGAFVVSRFLARDFISGMFGKANWFEKLDKGIETNGLYFILFIRLVPVFPFNGINFASGLTKVRFRDYFIGTAIGIIPASFVFANAASKAAQAASGGKIGAGFYISFALLGVIALIPAIYKQIKSKKKSGEENGGHQKADTRND
ncbi:hypothetical protein MNBD_NITROSPINAE04-80 [hydrothermal vent metagenome]|uniref:VTT domain-containing protein n=1 Tax=hydrothermal vent metagenome TaxID=652676 RepID=A0A3B1C816_9ZZZZ